MRLNFLSVFKTMLAWYACTAVVYLSMVLTGVYLADCLGAAIAEAIYFSLIDPWFIYVAIRPSGGRVIDLWRNIRLPLLGGYVVAGVAWLYGLLVVLTFPAHSDLERLLVMSLVAAEMYLLILHLCIPDELHKVWDRVSNNLKLFRSRLGLF